ncbi:MAG: lipopolysaccharide assembly protein LapA domain-containing protein [Rickettsiales bacterium]|nr:lipopolysaccharide assembly protein LapA domain-containing protein [Rickettsiales bacterium]
MRGGFKRSFRLISLTVLTLAFVVFAIDNREVAHVSLFPLPYAADMPLFLFALFCFFIGAMCGFISASLKTRRLAALLKHEQKKTAGLQNQLDASHAERVTALTAA